MNFAVIDIEASAWVDFRFLGYYDGENYYLFYSVSEFLKFVSKLEDKIIYAHNGGKYDFIFLFNEMWKNKDFPRDILNIQSSIVSFKYKNVEFRDSLKILPSSLKKLGKAFGYEKKEIDVENIDNVPVENVKEYLKNDCVITYCILKDYIASVKEFGINPGLTLASTAMRIYRRNFDELRYWKNYEKYFRKNDRGKKDLDCFEYDLSRRGYFGGRCEIFKMSGSDINCYDINSMYPSVMKDYRYPFGKCFEVYKSDVIRRYINSSFKGMIDCEVLAPDIYIPVLPYRVPTKLLFPLGKFRGVWTLDELRFAIEKGYKIIKYHKAVIWKKSKYIFSNYVDYFYNLKNTSKDEAKIFEYKLYLNSLYGKFGQKPEIENIILDYDNSLFVGLRCLSDEFGIWLKKDFSESSHMIPIISTHVTSYARMRLYKYLDENSLYCDTDSCHTYGKFKSSSELGKMKLEYHVKDAKYILPKMYFLNKDEGVKVKAKGFSKVDELKWNRIEKKEAIQSEGILSFKQALIMKKPLLSKNNLTRQIKATYNKRIILKNNDTRPIVIGVDNV